MKYLFAQALNLPGSGGGTGPSLTSILNIIFAIIGSIAVLVIVIAGVQFIISNGEPAKIATARNSILYAIVGLVIVIFAAAIVNFVLNGIFA